MKILVYAPGFDSKNGGVVVLHRLVHLINTATEHQAFLVPESYNLELRSTGFIKNLSQKVKHQKKARHYTTKPAWDTPVVTHPTRQEIEQSVVVYPEIVKGNPLLASKVIRWLLHQPGHFSGEIGYGKDELIFKFNSAIKDFTVQGSKTSSHELKVIYYPIDLYNSDGALPENERTLICHAIRKGKHKPTVHPENSILIDSLSHEEVAELFKQAKHFISYDDYTAYSIFATLCGCTSIVVPDEGVSLEQWYPHQSDRYGISYGFDEEQLNWSKRTSHLVKEHIDREHLRSIECVKSCLLEAEAYFSN